MNRGPASRGGDCPGNGFFVRGVLSPALLALACVAWSQLAGAEIEQPAGYRMERYDAEVPAALDGATTVDAIAVKSLLENDGAVVVDVIPEQRRPAALPPGQIWNPVEHRGIAGAIWLPDVGYGALSEATEAYFERHLRAATGGDPGHPVIFYCRADCWMSWNAAKRALSYGYRNVYWFADGLDGWLWEAFDTRVLVPQPGPRHATDAGG